MKAESIDVLHNLSDSVARCMQSKRTLRILNELQNDGLIEFDPLAGTGSLTAAGVKAKAEGTPHGR